MIANTLTLSFCLLVASADAGGGTISGVVVNATGEKTPLGGCQVVLRAMAGNASSICGETTTDGQGRFAFNNLQLGEEYCYLPGANRDGVHFPGARVQLTAQRPHVEVKLSVYDSITAPSPLVIRRQEIAMKFQAGALSVTESIIVDNPTRRCYVGASSQKDGEPITMQLAIPSDFERTTFQKEFFGRRFNILGDKLVTSVPWPPGQRELKFTYVLPIEKNNYLWQRPLDLPCEELRVRVQAADAREIACNLAAGPVDMPGELVYQSRGEILPKGHTVRVELGRLPVPLMAYARWLAVTLLVASFIAGGGLIYVHRRRVPKLHQHAPFDKHKSRVSCPKTSRRNIHA
jgi:hypothetical protein